MDKQGRLTKWDEWEVGVMYEFLKGGEAGARYKCSGIERKKGFVLLEIETGEKLREIPWRNRWRKVGPAPEISKFSRAEKRPGYLPQKARENRKLYADAKPVYEGDLHERMKYVFFRIRVFREIWRPWPIPLPPGAISFAYTEFLDALSALEAEVSLTEPPDPILAKCKY